MALALTGCGPSQEEIDNTAIITCNIMGESRNMDAAMRIKEINAAREKIGADPYLGTDSKIKESVKWGLCEELVKNDSSYYELLRAKKVAEDTRVANQKLREKKQATLVREEFLKSLEDAVRDSPIKILMLDSLAVIWFNAPIEIGEQQKANVSFKIADFEASGPLGFECLRKKPDEDIFNIYETPFTPICEVSLSLVLEKDAYDLLYEVVTPYLIKRVTTFPLASVPNVEYVVKFDS